MAIKKSESWGQSDSGQAFSILVGSSLFFDWKKKSRDEREKSESWGDMVNRDAI